MSPIRQKVLDAIAQTPDRDLEAMWQFLQSRPQPAIAAPISTSQQAWNQVVDRFNTVTPEQCQHQRQAVSELLHSWNHEADDPEEQEESWESLKIALEQSCDSV
jgi:hypothetical protein